MKKVSIIIPVYNGEDFVKEAIDCALAQTYKNVEVIVVNDGSQDGTDKICKSYKDKIRYFKKKNGGVSTALNEGIKNMTGDYFSWLSHDDLYKPDKIEKQMEFLKKNKYKDVVLYSDYECMNGEGQPFANPVVFDQKMLEEKPLYCMLRGCLNGITMLVPKKAFEELGEFDPSLRCTQDYDMWWKMIKKYKFVHMNELMTYTRIHAGQDTNTSPNVIKEGNPLWINMIEDVDDETKIKYEGSIYNYYYEMAKFLLTTPYEDAKNHCISKCKDIDLKKYKSNPVKLPKLPKYGIKNYIKDHGLVYTIKRIILKVLKLLRIKR